MSMSQGQDQETNRNLQDYIFISWPFRLVTRSEGLVWHVSSKPCWLLPATCSLVDGKDCGPSYWSWHGGKKEAVESASGPSLEGCFLTLPHLSQSSGAFPVLRNLWNSASCRFQVPQGYLVLSPRDSDCTNSSNYFCLLHLTDGNLEAEIIPELLHSRHFSTVLSPIYQK